MEQIFTSLTIAIDAIEFGYFHIPSNYYYCDSDFHELSKIQSSYYSLSADDRGGRRFRSQRTLSLINGVLSIDPPSSYSQKYEDNPDAEGKERIFQPISEDLINMPLWQKIIFSDLEIAKAIGEVKFDKKVEIGFHQVRYAPTPNEMSYSSPPWLHRDTEPTVFIHLINLTSNALGGENIIAFDPKPTSYHRMIKLVDPLDTLLVNRKHFHSVVPLAVERGQVAYRDILLVTFKNI